MPPPISWGIQSLRTCKKDSVWYCAKKLSGSAVCIGGDLVEKFAERCGLALAKGYLMIFVMSLCVILDLSLINWSIPFIHKQTFQDIGMLVCYYHNSGPIPGLGFWNPSLNYLKSLTGLLVEGRRLCIAGLPIEEGRPTAPRQRIRSEWRWVGNGPNEWSSRSSSWGNGPNVLFVDRQHLWSNIISKDLWSRSISQPSPVQSQKIECKVSYKVGLLQSLHV